MLCGKLRPGGLVIALWAVIAAPWPVHADDYEIYRVRLVGLQDRDPPYFNPGVIQEFDRRQQELWVRALEVDDVRLRCQVADAIVAARQMELGEWDAAVAPLMKLLDPADQHPVVRRAAAKALVELDARVAAEALARTSDLLGPPAAQVIEPALARWDFQPRRQQWLEQLSAAHSVSRRQLAIECLGIVQEPRAETPLRNILRDLQSPPHLRVKAANALAQIHDTGLAELARELAETKAGTPLPQILAASLLQRHRDVAAVECLTALSHEAEPVVVRLALQRLLEIDPQHVLPLAAAALRNRDVNVRRLAAKAYEIQADDTALKALSGLLEDVNPELRRSVREMLLTLAEHEASRPEIIRLAEGVLQAATWRGGEQAIIVLTRLGHKPCVTRLLELLSHERDEVYVTAAWGLAELQVPETLPAILAYAEAQHAKGSSFPDMREYESRYDQMGFLFQAMGIMRYAPAEPLLRRYVPKLRELGPQARSAAIWALGYLHEKEGNEELAKQFADRLTDIASLMPEVSNVRQASAISLGRMKTKTQRAVLEQFAQGEGPYSPIGQACIWALDQITGNKTPPPPKLRQEVSSAFLQYSGAGR